MEPIKFKGYNVIYAKDQPQYLPLPVSKTDDGEITCCWEMTFFERLKVLFVGKVWLSVLTFNKPLQPVRLRTKWDAQLKGGE